MLNRIRRAASLTRARCFPKGRHRRPLTPSRPTATPAFSAASVDASTVILGRASETANHRHSLAGEDNALVRPYVLAWEERVRPRPVVVASHLPAEAWSALAGVC
ncbi:MULTISPECIES: hypothetical protein [unclassified Streptomyces]|uniref:hypothetical protein n=1 Tax=Streptomyces sp. Ag109_G2-15 TaxID=1938850 RepID=UPI000BDAD2CA|nr:hypothetical protein SAMN06272765_3950 [Streptomyces sp. Ag109_G2-15]